MTTDGTVRQAAPAAARPQEAKLDFVTNEEVVLAARRNLNQAAWDYLVGGSESETTMRRNRLAFDCWAFRPRVLVDVSKIDASTTFLGHKLRIPVLLAPVGGLQLFHPSGGVGSARAAAEFGTVQAVSSVTDPSLEEIAASAMGPKIFQLYVNGDWPWVQEMISRVRKAGYAGLCLTVDSAVPSHRERPMLHRSQRAWPVNPYQAALSWDSLSRMRELAGDLPLLLKGIATAEDAALAVRHGIEVVWVSNHGGRQLDHQQGTMEMLPEIVEAVDGKAEIVLDGGVVRGSDVVKALALGARAVAIGKLQAWGLAAAGQAGVVRVLEVLENEVLTAMGLLGVTRVEQLTPAYVRKAEPVTAPHEMSVWVNMPGERLL